MCKDPCPRRVGAGIGQCAGIFRQWDTRLKARHHTTASSSLKHQSGVADSKWQPAYTQLDVDGLVAVNIDGRARSPQ